MCSVLLVLLNHKQVEVEITLIVIFLCLGVLKEQFQRKTATVEEIQIPNKPPLTENESTKKKKRNFFVFTGI